MNNSYSMLPSLDLKWRHGEFGACFFAPQIIISYFFILVHQGKREIYAYKTSLIGIFTCMFYYYCIFYDSDMYDFVKIYHVFIHRS
jgi:cbb3-type cytochrome oxidase subunit 1